MAKYHINPKTGVPGQCSASAGRCPFGGTGDHYDSPQAAVKGFEAKLVQEHKGTKPASIAISDEDLELLGRTRPKSFIQRIESGLRRGKFTAKALDSLLADLEAAAAERPDGPSGRVRKELARLRELDATPPTYATVATFDPATQSSLGKPEARKSFMEASWILKNALDRREEYVKLITHPDFAANRTPASVAGDTVHLRNAEARLVALQREIDHLEATVPNYFYACGEFRMGHRRKLAAFTPTTDVSQAPLQLTRVS